MDEAMTNLEGTTPMEEPVADSQPTEIEAPAAAPQDAEKPTEGGSPDAEPVTDDSWTLQYNHEDVKVSKDEAVRLAQYGLFLDKLGKEHSADVKDIVSKLDYVATIQGRTANDLIEELVKGVDSAYREELISELGADNPIVEEMLELRRSKNNKAYETAKAERSAKEKLAQEEAQKSATTKLAEQFEAVREMFPEYDTVEKVPDTVVKRALKSGDLEKEMLRYLLTERNKIEAAKASQEKNKNQNVGSVASDTAEDNVSSAFMKGLWG